MQVGKTLKENRTKFVCTVLKQSEAGITLLSLLFVLFVIVITLPIFVQIFKQTTETKYEEDLSFKQFFLFIRQDMIGAERIYENKNVLYFQLDEENVAMIEQYNDVVRRRVNSRGHEIYVRNIKEFETETLSYGIKLKITSLKGSVYEKTFVSVQ